MSEVVGSTIVETRQVAEHEMLPLEVARTITLQVALGLDYIHSHCILHGDLQGMNVSFQIPDVDSWTVEQIYECFG